MNLDFIREIGQQLARIWKEIKISQKFTVISVALGLLGLLIFLIVNAASTDFTALYPKDRLLISDAAEIKAYLESSGVAYEIKGDTLILVPSDKVHRVRMDLASLGLPKMNTSKGFELFDTNTWIKGEKELQVMEMRAMKGQLEKDISEYENIKSAKVILDIAPPRPFGGSMYKAKASVILTPMPGARLSTSQLRAITFHISGAVRGLRPNMVAISDTSGKLYQAFDPDGDMDMLRREENALEERVKSKVDGMLAMVVGHENFYSTVQVSMSRDKKTRERKIYQGRVDGIELGESVISSITESGLEVTEREMTETGTPGTNTEAVAGAVAGGGGEILNRDENRNQAYRQMAVPVDHLKINTTPGTVNRVSISVLIDKTITVDPSSDLPEEEMLDGRRDAGKLREEIENQLAKIMEGYGVPSEPAVDFVEFDKTKFNEKVAEETWSTRMDILTKLGTVFFVVAAVGGMLWTFNRFWKRHMFHPPSLAQSEEQDELDDLSFGENPSLVEVEAMIESIKTRFQNDPEAIVETFHDWLMEEEENLSRK